MFAEGLLGKSSRETFLMSSIFFLVSFSSFSFRTSGVFVPQVVFVQGGVRESVRGPFQVGEGRMRGVAGLEKGFMGLGGKVVWFRVLSPGRVRRV